MCIKAWDISAVNISLPDFFFFFFWDCPSSTGHTRHFQTSSALKPQLGGIKKSMISLWIRWSLMAFGLWVYWRRKCLFLTIYAIIMRLYFKYPPTLPEFSVTFLLLSPHLPTKDMNEPASFVHGTVGGKCLGDPLLDNPPYMPRKKLANLLLSSLVKMDEKDP